MKWARPVWVWLKILYPNLCTEDLLNMTGKIICGPKIVYAFVSESRMSDQCWSWLWIFPAKNRRNPLNPWFFNCDTSTKRSYHDQSCWPSTPPPFRPDGFLGSHLTLVQLLRRSNMRSSTENGLSTVRIPFTVVVSCVCICIHIFKKKHIHLIIVKIKIKKK